MVILDTNIMLHYLPPDQIDWLSVADADKVFILVYPILLKELTKAKDLGRNKSIRERAAAREKWLERAMLTESAPVRAGVYILINGEEPIKTLIDIGLDRQLNDDVIIATAVSYVNEHKEVLVVTADGGMRLKLKHYKISVAQLSDDKRLPSTPDAEQSELISLRRELQKYQSRMPKLKVTKPTDVSRIRSPITMHDKQAWVEQGVSKHKEKDQNQSKRSYGSFSSLELAGDNIIGRYYPGFEEALKKYYSDLWDWLYVNGGTSIVRLVVTNDGNAIAQNVRVLLNHSDNIEIIHPSDLPRKPSKPDPFGAFGPNRSLMDAMVNQPYAPGSSRGPYLIAPDKSELFISRIQHQDSLKLNEIAIRIGRDFPADNIVINYSIYCDEIMEATEGVIKIELPDRSEIREAERYQT